MIIENIDKIAIGLISAFLALILKSTLEYLKKKSEISKLKQVLVTDLVHLITTANLFSKETKKIKDIYQKGLNAINNKQVYNFYPELQSTQFNEVFFSNETFNTLKKTDLLIILGKNSRSFGEIHNIYHIATKLKGCNSVYYEDIFDEHLKAYLDGVGKENSSEKIDAMQKALNYITLKLQADINNSNIIRMLIQEYLLKLIGKRKLLNDYGIKVRE